MIVEGRINGSEPLSFIVDTGASASVVHHARAEQLRLPLRSKEEATTGGGTVEAIQIQDASLSIGEATLRNLPLVAIDLTALRAGLGVPGTTTRLTMARDGRARQITIRSRPLI
jgi:predicted aspartyl protease